MKMLTVHNNVRFTGNVGLCQLGRISNSRFGGDQEFCVYA